ncbi:hypothetical protein D3C73_804320 [compost metagenome]
MLDKGRKRLITEWFAIHQQVMALHLGLIENTVCSKLKELQKKGFIEVQRRGRRNYYRLSTTLNPYVVLSEVIHTFIKQAYPKSNYGMIVEHMTDEEKENYKDKQDALQEAVVTCVLPMVKDKDFYSPYIGRIVEDIRNGAVKESGMRLLTEYQSIVDDLWEQLNEKVERQFRTLAGAGL